MYRSYPIWLSSDVIGRCLFLYDPAAIAGRQEQLTNFRRAPRPGQQGPAPMTPVGRGFRRGGITWTLGRSAPVTTSSPFKGKQRIRSACASLRITHACCETSRINDPRRVRGSAELVGKAVVLTDGKAGTVENVWLDELHGLRLSIESHDGKWPISTIKFAQP